MIGLGGFLNALYDRHQSRKQKGIQSEGAIFPVDYRFDWEKSFTRGMGEAFIYVAEMALFFGALKLLFPDKKKEAAQLESIETLLTSQTKLETPNNNNMEYQNNWRDRESQRKEAGNTISEVREQV